MQADGNISILLAVELDSDITSTTVSVETADLAYLEGFVVGGVYGSIEIKLLVDSFCQGGVFGIHLYRLGSILLDKRDGWEEGGLWCCLVGASIARRLTGRLCWFTSRLGKRRGGVGLFRFQLKLFKRRGD